jgi:hypothetical protein
LGLRLTADLVGSTFGPAKLGQVVKESGDIAIDGQVPRGMQYSGELD